MSVCKTVGARGRAGGRTPVARRPADGQRVCRPTDEPRASTHWITLSGFACAQCDYTV